MRKIHTTRLIRKITVGGVLITGMALISGCSDSVSIDIDATDEPETTTGTTDGIDGTDTSDGTDGSDTANGTDVNSTAGSTGESDSTDGDESSTTSGTDGSDATDGTDEADNTDGTDGSGTADGTDEADNTDGTDGSDSTDTTDGTDTTGSTDGSSTTDSADGGDTAGDTGGSGTTDSTDGSDAADTTDATDSSNGVIDIYDAIFSARSADCADYVNTFDASPVDIQNSITFDADVVITATDTDCTITSNSIPNHDFNDDTASFAGGAEGATIAATDTVSTITRTPAFAASPTPISQTLKNGIFLNGVRLDIISAGCYRPNSADAGEDGNTGVGCSETDDWLLDPLGTETKFGADLHNAHTQPGGLYHYHGGPEAMFDDNPSSDGSPVIGFAADGFPIYGSYFYDNSTGAVRKALSGYFLKAGSRGTRSDTNPGGDYDGTYNDDWEFTNGGDLDECNGMTIDGQYGYYVTDTYPWVVKCLSGTPDASFGGGDEGEGGGGGGGGGGRSLAPLD